MGNIKTSGGNRLWFRTQGRRANKQEKTLGVIPVGKPQPGFPGARSKTVRDFRLENLDKYYRGAQYDGLSDWITAAKSDDYVAIRDRKPLVNYNLAKVLAARISAKLIGRDVYPACKVEGDPDTEEFQRFIDKTGKLQHRLVMAFRQMAVQGAVLTRFYIQPGAIKVENYKAMHCYPSFMSSGDLQAVMIKYVFEDEKDLDSSGSPKKKWYRMDLTQEVDTLYDNPEYNPDVEPDFKPVSEIPHQFGFVQAEWFRTYEDQHTPDGISLIEDILPFVDDLNYSLSQSSQAIGYNQDPQALFKNMDEEDILGLIRSSQKGWNLGRDGDASFLESDLGAVQRAIEFRDRMRLNVQDLARVILLDPEKVVAHAQSGRAMEVLHGPMVELINELRPQVEDRIISLKMKMMMVLMMLNQYGFQIPITIPPGYRPKSLALELNWPPIFQQTMQDLRDKVNVVSMATNGNLISRETGTRYLAKDFGVDDIEAELQRIEKQPVLNPFGAF